MGDTIKKIAFLLGREHEICLEELKSVLSRFCFSFSIFRISGNIVFANMENISAEDLRQIMQALGGTIKIFELVGSLGNNITNQVAELITKERGNAGNKVNFGISCFNRKFTKQQINSFALGAKKKLKGKISLRFVEAKDGLELSSIQTLKNDLDGKGLEFGIFDEEIGILIALNNPEEWNKRDYGKPASDKYSGMVPPKLARMMVNIALVGNKNEKPLIIDPFCGSGNVLMEAMMLGCDVIGSDISPKAVNDSSTNIEWLLKQNSDNRIQNTVFQADALSEDYIKKLSTLDFQLSTSNKNLIFVTEPFLGEPKKFKPSYNSARGEYEKIKRIYLSFLKNLTGATTICLVFPLVETEDQGQFSLYKDSVDEIKNLGYTQVRPTMIYGREYQVVKREIVLLKLEDTRYKKQ